MSEPTQAQLELAAVNKAILAILNNDGVVEYYIGDRRAIHSDLEQLYRIQAKLQLRVHREQGKVRGIKTVGIKFR